MTESKQNIQIKIERFHLSVKLGSIFFPLELPELRPVLEEAGYTIRKELVERLPETPTGVRLVVGGPIAEKRGTSQTFRLDPDRGIVAIAGQDVNAVVEDFLNLEGLIKDKLDVPLSADALFYEFIAEGSAVTGKDPTKVVARLFQGSRLQSKISEILGCSTTNFGVRVVEQNRYVTDRKWLDFSIEPLIPKPKTTYRISVTYRHPERENVVRTAKSLSRTVQALLSAIEQEA